MRVILNEQGYVQEYAIIGEFGTPSIVVDEPENIEDFENNYRSYCILNGKLVSDSDKQLDIENERMLHGLRAQRKSECFPYVNRGYLWYSRLTDEQKKELDSWYQAWLDVTETQIIPDCPEWLI